MTQNNSFATVAQDADIERTVEETMLDAGESTTVELTGEMDDELGEGEIVRVTDEFSPAFGDVTVDEISPAGGTGGAGPDNETLIVVWNEDADSYSVTYEVTVPPTAATGDTFDITGTLEIGDAEQALPSETITVEAGAAGVQLSPSDASVDVEDEAVFDVEMVGGDDGVESYSLPVSLSDPSVGEITSVDLTNDPDSDNSSIADDGSSATVAADMGDNDHEGADSITLAEVAVAGEDVGTTEVVLEDDGTVTGADSQSYDLGFYVDATLTVDSGEPSVDDYTDEDGNAEPADVFDAIDDWRDDEIGPDIIFGVIDAWRNS